MFYCSNVQMFNYSIVQGFKRSNVQISKYSIFRMFKNLALSGDGWAMVAELSPKQAETRWSAKVQMGKWFQVQSTTSKHRLY